jgi:sporulation protein YlmC with PRC-barrel domain
MLYLSQLLGAPVEDPEGARVGKIIDILIVQQEESPSRVILVVEGQEDRRWYVPTDAVELQGNVLRLRIPVEQLSSQPGASGAQEVSLVQDVLDKQVIDLARKKAVRVNDICFDDNWHILGIDNSTLGLVRRLAPSWLLGAKSRPSPTKLIPWDRIQLIGTPTAEEEEEEQIGEEPSERPAPEGASGPLRPQSGQLAELRPADIADIVHQLTPGQGARLLEGLDDETAANVLEEIDTERQSHILENIRPDRAADILQAMEPDEAADLLATLPEERAQELLRLMTPEESEDVQELLEYEENSAGGLMTTDYIALNFSKTVAEALNAVRNHTSEQDAHDAYIYCVANETQDESPLLGVVSLWNLLVSDPAQPIGEVMETDPVTVQPDTDPRHVAEIMAKYNLLAVPVVSPEGILEGVVTVDDALDVLLPAELRRKPTRMY